MKGSEPLGAVRGRTGGGPLDGGPDDCPITFDEREVGHDHAVALRDDAPEDPGSEKPLAPWPIRPGVVLAQGDRAPPCQFRKSVLTAVRARWGELGDDATAVRDRHRVACSRLTEIRAEPVLQLADAYGLHEAECRLMRLHRNCPGRETATRRGAGSADSPAAGPGVRPSACAAATRRTSASRTAASAPGGSAARPTAA